MSEFTTELDRIVAETLRERADTVKMQVTKALDKDLEKAFAYRFGLYKDWGAWEVREGSPAAAAIDAMVSDLKDLLRSDERVVAIKEEVLRKATKPKALRALRGWLSYEVKRTLQEEILNEWASNEFRLVIKAEVAFAVADLLKKEEGEK